MARWNRRRRVLAAAGAGAVLLGVAGAAGAVAGNSGGTAGGTAARASAEARATAGARAAAGARVPATAGSGNPATASTGPAQPAAAASGDSPAGFWYGTDSWPVSGTGPAPYHEPVVGGSYGGYIGMAGNWAAWQGCGDKVAWSAANSRQANASLRTGHAGIGTGVYWFMAGPGVDPHYNGTAGEAAAWGRAQAAVTLRDIRHLGSVTYPVVFADVEIPGDAPGITPASDNGWNSAYSSPCSGRVTSSHIAPAVDRADLDGFFSYLTSHSSYQPGVYSAPPIWTAIFGTGKAASLHAYEWTYLSATGSLARRPAGWCLAGTRTCAQFFGGVRPGSRYALMWQWSGGGGYLNGHGDFDQIDGARTP